MAYQVIDRNSGIFNPRSSDEINNIIQNIDEKIDNWSNREKAYRYTDVHSIIVDGASHNLSFTFGHKIVLHFSFRLATEHSGIVNLSCSELKKMSSKFLLKGVSGDNNNCFLLYDNGKFSLPMNTKSGEYHFYAVLIW